jgi:hypothetical protein
LKKNNRYTCLILIAHVLTCLSSAVSADQLEPRFYPPGTNNLVAYYDPHLDITVTADLNLSWTLPLANLPVTNRNYENAEEYIKQLNFTNNQKGYLDVNTWRLPISFNNDAGCDLFPEVGVGYYCSKGEVGHIFYTEFNGEKLQGLPPVWPFKETIYGHYWSSTKSAPLNLGDTVERSRLAFDMSKGFQKHFGETWKASVWPVTDGDPLARPAVKILGIGLGHYFPPTDVNTTSNEVERIEVENSGNAPLTIQAINQTNATEFPVFVDQCSGQVLNPGESCDFALRFSPIQDGGRTSTLQIVSDALSSPDTFTASGTGVGVAVEVLTPSELQFGLIPTHLITPESIAASEKSVVLENSGTAAFSVQSVISDQPEFTVTYENCSGLEISPQDSSGVHLSCNVRVKFHPVTPGAKSGHILITTDSSTSPISVALTGTGTEPNLVLSSYVQDFSNQALNTTSAAHTVTATNTGNETLRFFNASVTDIGIRSDSNEFRIINDQCGASLDAGASCTFDIVFEPSAQGPRSGKVHIAGYDRTVLLSGIGEAVALELLIPNDLHFGEQAVGSSSTAQSVFLANLGSADISVTSIIPDNPAFAVDTDNCSGQVVVPNASCGFSIRFSPSVSGAQVGHVVVNSDAPSSPDNVAVTGTGTIPALLVAPGQLMFGQQEVGTHALPLTMVLTNTGKADLLISALNSALSDFPIISENCIGRNLPSGSNCHVVVGFVPGRDGGISSSIAITSNASTSPDNVIVSGTGDGAGSVLLDPTILHFGSHPLGTTTAPQVVTLTNSGTASLNVASLSSDNAEYVIVTDGCSGQSIAPAGTCQFGVEFSASLMGIQNGHITVPSDASSSPDHVALTGTGITPSVQLSDSNIHFGPLTVGDSATPQTITATNTGSAPLSISSIDSSNPEFSIGADTCSSQVLAAAAQCSFAVGFTPTSDGAQSASLQFISNAGTSPDTISAAGSGKRVSSETLSPSSLTFPTVVIGQPAITRQVLLTNTGSANLVVGSISSASPHYSVVDNLCSGMSIAPQTHCTFSVTFSPNAVGTWDSQIEIHTDIPSSPDLLPVTGTGASSLIPPEPAVPVPAISKWALILLLMLFGLAVFTQRRNLL